MKAKRVLSAILTVIMLLSAVVLPAAASEIEQTHSSTEIGGDENATLGAADDTDENDGTDAPDKSIEQPYFESLEFLTTAFVSGAWVTGKTFTPAETEYSLPLKTYSTSSLTLQKSTLYDTDKYTATAEYTDFEGEPRQIAVKSGAVTSLPKQPFGESILTITLASKDNADCKTVYTFTVTRPRDTSKAIKSSGIVLSPAGRDLLATTYRGAAEGAMQKADESGSPTSGVGVTSKHYFYRTFLYDSADSFRLTLTASTAYAHIRYSADGGENWNDIESGGMTDAISIPKSGGMRILIRILDDAAYTASVAAGSDGFADGEPAEYTVWVDSVTPAAPSICTAVADDADWYPAFSGDAYLYQLIVNNDAAAPILRYTVSDGCTVKIGSAEQTPDDDGIYTLTLKTSQQSISVTSADGDFSTVYKIGYKAKSALDVPDRVVDYLCIGSQYTNVSYGTNPELTLTGSVKSLGNFGGYITYYYDNPLTDNPNNKYGMDFYVVGNSMESNIDSMAELGQVYVSEDGTTWYALAGSEHYEKNAHTDYTITYSRGDDGKAYWSDNYGNKIDYAATAWPSASVYYMNDVASQDSYTFTGVSFDCQDGSITGNSASTTSFAAKAGFGYADYYASNISVTTLADINPYVATPSKANGFDLAWAVDKDGVPVDVSGMEFHYVKVATASNIYAGAFKEKSTEISYVSRTTAQAEAVGKTDAPSGVTISDGANTKVICFTDGQNVCPVDIGDMKYVTIKVNGAAEDDNIYINNQRTAPGEAASGFKVTKVGNTLVRIIVQSGDKEPSIHLLKLSGSAAESNELVEGVKINADGAIRVAETKNSTDYTATVGARVSEIGIVPCIAPDVAYTINGAAPAEKYPLNYGKNEFVIAAANASGSTQTYTLTVTRSSEPSTSDKTITVSFTLYGDEIHKDSETHTYKNDKGKLPIWIKTTRYTVPIGSTVLDVFELALNDAGIAFVNAGGNYIASIDGLSEFDNGPLSGWMYLVNSKHPSLGVAEQTLKNGDRIIFHYTDDYTNEQGSESWSNTPSTIVYTVRFDTDGADTISAQKIKKGEKVKCPDAPTKDGFGFDGWYTDKALTEPYDFDATVKSSFTLYAKWTEVPTFDENTFADVNADDWYYDAVCYVYKKGLMRGTGTDFEPNVEVTRAMVVTLLYRLDGSKETVANTRFEDVSSGEWYSEAIAWAAENQIVSGIDDTHFAPNAPITREQLAAILCRYASINGLDTSARADLSAFADLSAASEWGVDALSFAAAAGLVKGTSDNELSPQGTATRAQIAVVFMRLCENLIK